VKIFLATMENLNGFDLMPDNYLKYALVSFFNMNEKHLEKILSKVQYLLVDSGAHSFQHGAKVDFDEFTNKYVDFIKRYTNHPKMVGFFEMDVDNVIGYEKVKELRKKLESVSNKTIPVWHNNRGIDDFYAMCKEYKGRRVAITGFKNNDIYDEQYNLFINAAHSEGCNVHILGMTRIPLIKELNLARNDSVDSSSWRQMGVYGRTTLVNHNKQIQTLLFASGSQITSKQLIRVNFLTYKYLQHIYDDVDNSLYKGGETDDSTITRI